MSDDVVRQNGMELGKSSPTRPERDVRRAFV
jgi:hypothetical protein